MRQASWTLRCRASSSRRVSHHSRPRPARACVDARQTRRLRGCRGTTPESLEIEPNGWRNYHELGGLHFRAGNYAQAANYYDLEVALLPNDSRALNNLGAGLLESLIESDANFDSALNRPVTTTMEEP